MKIEFQGLTRQFDNNRVILNPMDFSDDIHTLAIIGPSGGGKSTLLRILGGLILPTAGQLMVDGKKVPSDEVSLQKYRRELGFVFQQGGLFRHLSAFENITLPLCQVHGYTRQEAEKRAAELLERFGLSGDGHKKPSALSGGQQQRVAIARALVTGPAIICMDEPLSNLDAKLRVSMRTEIRRIQQEVGITAIYVTHDQSEAMALSDNIIIMNKGVVAQMGTPQEIYYHPNSEFVADFIGEANFLTGTLEGLEGDHAVLRIEGNPTRVPAKAGMKSGEAYTVVLRPESAVLADQGGLPCKVILSCFMGSYQNYHVMVGNTLVKLTDYNPKNKRIYQVGERCHLAFDPESVHIL